MSFDPIYDENSRLLILGSYPSPRSREVGFYYGHPQNRFWKVLSAVYDETEPSTVEQKKSLLLRNGIALWDVCQSCSVEGASDASIRNVAPNEVEALLRKTAVQRVFCNGSTAGRFYEKFVLPQSNIPATVLPSTSPANARWRLPQLIAVWKKHLWR